MYAEGGTEKRDSNSIRGNGQTKKADQYTQMCECVNGAERL